MFNFLLGLIPLSFFSLVFANLKINKIRKKGIENGKDKGKYGLTKPLSVLAVLMLALVIFSNNKLVNTFEMATFIALPAIGLLVYAFASQKEVNYDTYLTIWAIDIACICLYCLTFIIGFIRVFSIGGAYNHAYIFRAFYLIILAQLLFKCIMDCKKNEWLKIVKNKVIVGVAGLFMVASLFLFGNNQGIEMSSTSKESYLSDITYVYNKDGSIKHNDDGSKVTKNHYDTKTVTNRGVVGYFYFVASLGICSALSLYFVNRNLTLVPEANVASKENNEVYK